MKICFFGSYDPTYPRNKILIDGLEKNGVSVVHCRSMSGSILVRYPELIRKFLSAKDQTELIYVAFVGQLNVPLAWVLGKLFGKKVVFDMFYSMYDTYIFDRQSAKPGSFRAFTYWLIDKVAVTLADIVITDTQAHADYFVRLLQVDPNKFKKIFVGGDETIFKTQTIAKRRKIRVIFHGMFTRLHGAEYFVAAVKSLEKEKNLEFILVGSSQNYMLPISLYKSLKPKNLTYYPEMPVSKLATLLARCDISVGHLGNTIKAKSVITNKMFQALASRVAVIAGDCSANRELFTHQKNAWFVKMGDSYDLAKAILYLSKRPRLIDTLSKNGYDLFQKELTNSQIGQRLLQVIKRI